MVTTPQVPCATNAGRFVLAPSCEVVRPEVHLQTLLVDAEGVPASFGLKPIPDSDMLGLQGDEGLRTRDARSTNEAPTWRSRLGGADAMKVSEVDLYTERRHHEADLVLQGLKACDGEVFLNDTRERHRRPCAWRRRYRLRLTNRKKR